MTPWTVAQQAPLSMGFSRQEYCSGLPYPPPDDLPDPGIKLMSPVSPALQADSLPEDPLGNLKSSLYKCAGHSHSAVSGSATPWTVAHQAPLSMGSSRQEYWSEVPLPSPGALPGPGIEPMSPALASGFFSTEPPGMLHFKQEYFMENYVILLS